MYAPPARQSACAWVAAAPRSNCCEAACASPHRPPMGAGASPGQGLHSSSHPLIPAPPPGALQGPVSSRPRCLQTREQPPANQNPLIRVRTLLPHLHRGPFPAMQPAPLALQTRFPSPLSPPPRARAQLLGAVMLRRSKESVAGQLALPPCVREDLRVTLSVAERCGGGKALLLVCPIGVFMSSAARRRGEVRPLSAAQIHIHNKHTHAHTIIYCIHNTHAHNTHHRACYGQVLRRYNEQIVQLKAQQVRALVKRAGQTQCVCDLIGRSWPSGPGAVFLSGLRNPNATALHPTTRGRRRGAAATRRAPPRGTPPPARSRC